MPPGQNILNLELDRLQNMKPEVGTIVHYVSYGKSGGEYPVACCAAIVTEVGETDGYAPPPVSLAVLNPTGMFFKEHIGPGEAGLGGTWHWRECVE